VAQLFSLGHKSITTHFYYELQHIIASHCRRLFARHGIFDAQEESERQVEGIRFRWSSFGGDWSRSDVFWLEGMILSYDDFVA
jgi:hypothetical protein